MDKYYVSTVVNNGGFDGLRRLTPYYKTRIEAENYYNRVFHAYNNLMLKVLRGRKRLLLKCKG